MKKWSNYLACVSAALITCSAAHAQTATVTGDRVRVRAAANKNSEVLQSADGHALLPLIAQGDA